jgi:hypothetical protein
VLLQSGGEVSLQPPLHADFQAGGAAVAGIGNEGARQLTGVGLDAIQHGEQVRRVDWQIAETDGHDHLLVTIDGGMGGVALNPAIRTREDVTVGIVVGETFRVTLNLLSLRLGARICIAWQRPLRNRRWISLGGGNGTPLEACGLSLLDRQLLSLICPIVGTMACGQPITR